MGYSGLANIFPSVSSFIQCRIEAFQLDTGVGGGELPVDLGLDPIPGGLPSGNFIP